MIRKGGKTTKNNQTPNFKIKSIEAIKLISKEERIKAIEKAGLNIFLLKSNEIFIDLLTDSGTNAMSQEQWSAIMKADESYAGAKSFDNFKNSVSEVTGFEFVLPVHQGRAAEHILDSVLIKEGNVILGNIHFDTTLAHIEYRKGIGINCVIKTAFDCEKKCDFKGNIDLEKLEEVLEKNKGNVAYVLTTVTCNSGGGQPVSMENIRKTSELCKKYSVLFFLDAARFAENCFFIKKREKGFENKSIREIALEMFSFADGCTMSAKKDAIVNMGGFIGFREKELFDKCIPFCILFEGFPTYGGLSGRDLEAIAVGLKEGIQEDYLRYRIGQVKYLGEELEKIGVPVMKPIGGHAVFVNGKKFLSHIPQEQYPSHTLAVELYIESGIRAVEIGTLLAGRDPKTEKEIMPELDLMRLTIPRRVYLKEHMDYIVEAFKKLKERKTEIKGLKFKFESPILRHFQSTFTRAE
ncbi:tryptophanase [Candidatus Micrarchaeota archaeon]|nr:tryptophanase [Candidatus Micrarchaeota archaeon]